METAGSAGVSRLPQGPENHTYLSVRQVVYRTQLFLVFSLILKADREKK